MFALTLETKYSWYCRNCDMLGYADPFYAYRDGLKTCHEEASLNGEVYGLNNCEFQTNCKNIEINLAGIRKVGQMCFRHFLTYLVNSGHKPLYHFVTGTKSNESTSSFLGSSQGR